MPRCASVAASPVPLRPSCPKVTTGCLGRGKCHSRWPVVAGFRESNDGGVPTSKRKDALAMFTDPRAQLKSVEAGLINEFADRLPNDVIHAEFERAQREFHDVRVKNFLAVLVHRRASDVLRSKVPAPG